MACTLLVLYESHTISFPSCEADTRFLDKLNDKHTDKSDTAIKLVVVAAIVVVVSTTAHLSHLLSEAQCMA